MGLLSKLFGKVSVDFKQLKKDGAIVLDVRSNGEYKGGHIKDSLNIPLNELAKQLNKFSKDKAIICVCASGIRSGSAKKILSSHGFNQVHNGGSWKSLESKITA